MFKLLKIASYYNPALKYYLQRRGKFIENLSYHQALADLLDFGLGWANFYQKALQKLGVDAHEIVFNADFVQKKWAIEHNRPELNALEILYEQIKELKPEVIWFQDSITFPVDFIRTVRQLPFVRLLIGNSCAPYSRYNLKVFREFDFLTTCAPPFEQEFKSYGIDALMLYQAFDKQVLDKIKKTSTPQYKVIFIGSILAGKNNHIKRKEFLEYLLNNQVDLTIFANIQGFGLKPFLKNSILYNFRRVVELTKTEKFWLKTKLYRKSLHLDKPQYFSISKKLVRRSLAPKFGIDMFQTLAQSEICVNIHLDLVKDYAANMRMFEATGVGTVLLTDYRKNLPQLFDLDSEIVTYKSFDEAVEKIRWLEQNPQKAEQIALAGQKRTLSQHTYENRAQKLVEKITKKLQ